jgi:predicted Ser/Thr protein kinase
LKEINIIKKLGAGNYGEVYLGDWLGTSVALKKLKDDNDFQEFQREASTLS